MVGNEVALAAAAMATVGMLVTVGFAGRKDNARRVGYIGPGRANDPLAVWCVQKLINDSPAPAWIETDGEFGPDTEAAIIAFQIWARDNGWGTVPDGDVGPITGNALLLSFSCDLDSYCYDYLPTTY
ncbi:peptidoglycan-binding domain-containing protein [Embleya sp. AB8]|uniref:peptidoglycan-binding domain-containing protein n=1 Tax=Embleya sp. AB8 TaxID=3156304 RepID=UPI003C73F90D